MKLIYKIGDMFESPSTVLAHGCNSHGIMKSGVAKTMVERHYAAYVGYRNAFDLNGLHVGEVIFAHSKDRDTRKEKIIANCITQKDYGRDPNFVYVSYDGIRKAVQALNEYVRAYVVGRNEVHLQDDFPTVTFPLIGAGLANGDWGVIAQIIEEESVNFQPIIYVQNQETLDKALDDADAVAQLVSSPEEVFAICINNDNYPVSLTVGRTYSVNNLIDTPEGMVRVLDDTNEYYLYSNELFSIINSPETSEECK